MKNVDQSIRISGVLIALGLLVELVSFLWDHPLSFIVFVGVGGLLLAAGILYFLYTISLGDRGTRA